MRKPDLSDAPQQPLHGLALVWSEARPALRRRLLTAAIFGGLSVVYALYALTVAPLLTPAEIRQPSVQTLPAAAPPSPREAVALAELWLAAQRWAADAKHVVRTDKSLIYFEDWQPVDSDEAIRFRPFAMIWLPNGSDESARPYTIECESAYVRFSSKFDVTDPNPGRVIGGALEGDVRIRGPEALTVLGSNFTFSEKALGLWSAAPIEFDYGPHHGTAVGFQADLIPDPQARRQNKLAVAGVRSIRLLRSVAMDLEFRGSRERDGTGGPQADSGRRPRPPRLVAVRSDGSFEFFVEKNTAVFEDSVRIDHPTDPGEFDRLRCDLLTLLFEPQVERREPAGAGGLSRPGTQIATGESAPERRQPSAGDESGRFRGLDSNLEFRQLQAEGPHVVLTSDRNNLSATMTQLIYNAPRRLTQLSDPRPVRVVQDGSELRCPRITLLQDDDGQIVSAWCAGRGWLKHYDRRTGRLQLDARWEKMLRKYPDPQTGLDVFELEQQAVARQPEEQLALAADKIRLWVERREHRQPDQPPLATPPHPDGDRREQFVPQRLLAVGDVTMAGSQMQARTAHLEILFQQPVASTPANLAAHTNSQPLVQFTSRYVAIPESRPTADGSPDSRTPRASGGRNGAAPGAAPEHGPVHVVADAIRVDMQTGLPGADPQVTHVWTEGRVQVRQEHPDGESPLEITGDRLEIDNRGEHDQVVDVFGQPAHVRDRGLHIEGDTVHFDRGRNVANVEGGGLLQLPVQHALDGRKLPEPLLLDVWWNEQMDFDGETAKFFGGVRGVLEDSTLRCEQMQVLLTERLSFAEAAGGADRRRPEVQRIICRDGVEIDSYQYVGSKLLEIRRGQFAEFNVNQQSGDMLARGPGSIRFWRRGRGKRAGLSPQAQVQANRPLAPDDLEWEFTQVDFRGTADGNLRERLTVFHDRVRILYGPVERPLATIDPYELSRDAGWMSSDQLRVLQHAGPDSQTPGHIELHAEGNAELEGRTFTGQADVISFDESKGLYMLRSSGKRTATIWRQVATGAERSEVNAQRMEFIPARNQLKMTGATGLQGLQ